MPTGVYTKKISVRWSKESIEKRTITRRINGWWKNNKLTKEKISNKLKGRKQSKEFINKRISKLIGRKQREDTKQKNREWHIHNPNKINKDTSIELKIENELKNRKIQYQKQFPLCKVAKVDFYLPEHNIIIQADGDYWHDYPFGTEKDRKQDDILKENGYTVYRFWERDINKSVEDCINKIKV